MVVTPMNTRTAASEICAASSPGGADADDRARQHDRQDAPVPVLAVDPERGGVLRHHDRQHDGGGLQRRHHQRQHRRRHLPDAGKAALGQAERHHGGHGEQIEQGVGDDGHGRAFAAACESSRMPSRDQRSRRCRPHCAMPRSHNGAGRPRRCAGASFASLVCACRPFHNRGQRRPRGGARNGRPREPLSRRLCALAARPGGVLGRGRGGDRLVSSSRRRSSTRTPASTAAGSPAASATPATTRSTATSRAAATTRRR